MLRLAGFAHGFLGRCMRLGCIPGLAVGLGRRLEAEAQQLVTKRISHKGGNSNQ